MGQLKLSNVRLLDGIFGTSQELGKQYLLQLDPDRLLAPCFEAMGKTPKAPRYGGWEARGIAGHSLGHWLSACALMYSATKDKQLLERVSYTVGELSSVQDEQGYVSGVKREVYDTVFSGDFTVERFSLAGEWVPWYSIHKLYQGLIDVYRETDMQAALDCVIRLADWAKQGIDRLTDEQMEKMLICEHGGMNEVFAELYQITGNHDYLSAAERFTDKTVIQPLLHEQDKLEGLHANTQIPKIIGAAAIGTEDYLHAAQFFYDTVTGHRSYVIGGNSNFEHFEKIDTELLGTQTCETCNTNNMLKLTSMLFDRSHDSRYFDYYEKALFNHILASQDPDSGMKTYFMSTAPGHLKVYCTPENSFWCCTGTGMENPARYGRDIYYSADDSLYVNLFISSEVQWNGMTISQKTNFPYSPVSRLTIEEGEGEFTLKIRIPSWNEGELAAGINQKMVQRRTKDGYAQFCRVFEELYQKDGTGYLEIKRYFKKGDTVDIGMHLALTAVPAKDDTHKIAFQYGPIVLAGCLGTERFPESDIQDVHTALDSVERTVVPPIVTEETDVRRFVHLVDPDTLSFCLELDHDQILLQPFYAVHHQRYTLYWQHYTAEEFAALCHEREIYERKLEQITVDTVRPNEQQSELDHQLAGAHTRCGYALPASCGYRLAIGEDGYFSYTLNAKDANYLMVSYWGSDDCFTMDEVFYTRSFDILYGKRKMATKHLRTECPESIIHDFYKLPKNHADTITITFRTKGAGTAAGGIFGVRTVKEKLCE